MNAAKSVRADEKIQSPDPGPFEIDPSPLLGHWINTNSITPGIARVIISGGGRDVSIRVFAASGPTPREWGDADVEVVYSAGVQSPAAMAFVARYDFGFVETRLEANLSLGLLVIAAFNTFRDGSGRSNYFAREFFYRAQESSVSYPERLALAT
jgi:hypothetical protein